MSLLQRVLAARDAPVRSVMGASYVDAHHGRARIDDERIRLACVRAKRAMMERVGFDEVARLARIGDVAAARRELRPALEAVLHADADDRLTPGELERAVEHVLNDVVGLGPLQPLLDDDGVTEIMVNGCGCTFIERGGSLRCLGSIFESDEQIRIIIDRVISPLGRRVDERSPMVNARLANGYRINAVIPPVAIDGPMLTIRKFSDRISALEHLVDLGSIPSWYAQLLSFAVRMRQDLAVAGGTGSGKTTLLNALSCEIPPNERIVTIEDSAELKFSRHPHVVRLEARDASIEGEGEVSIHDLLVNALRMRPDRIVVGEVRNREAIDMLEAMNTGHDGSLTTLHAGSAEEAVVRLTLLARYGVDLSSDLIEEQIAMALDGIVMSVRLPSGERFVSSYTGVSRAGDGGVRLREFVSFDTTGRTWRLEAEPPFIERGASSGALKREEVERWRRSCRDASACSRQAA